MFYTMFCITKIVKRDLFGIVKKNITFCNYDMLNSNPAADSNLFLSSQAFVIPVSGSFHKYLKHSCVNDNGVKLRIGK